MQAYWRTVAPPQRDESHRRALSQASRAALGRQFQHRFGDSLRRLLLRVMAHPRQDAARERPGEEAVMVLRCAGRLDAIDLALQRNARHRDFGLTGELLLDRLQRRIASRIAETMAIRLNRHVDEIRIVER